MRRAESNGRSLRRFFCETLPESGEVEIGDQEAHHLLHVLRMKVGDKLELFDGRDCSAVGVVEELLKRSVRVRIESKSQVSVELPFRLVIAAAVPKGDRQQFMVEKLVELGCTELWPVTYQRSSVKIEKKTVMKWRRYVLEASKQCGRNRLMEIREPISSREVFAADVFAGERWLADPYSSQPLELSGGPSDSLIAVGPEGGLTEDELGTAQESEWRTGHLGPRILRLETAAMAVAARASLLAD